MSRSNHERVGKSMDLLRQGLAPFVERAFRFGVTPGVTPGELAGVDALLAEARMTELQKANRVVLVCNRISPGNPDIKPDGTAAWSS